MREGVSEGGREREGQTEREYGVLLESSGDQRVAGTTW
jgi:hypothetical protein